MFGDYVYDASGAPFATQSMLLIDHLPHGHEDFGDAFSRRGFTVVRWKDDLSFRIEWEDRLKGGKRLAVIALPHDYVPYDLAQLMTRYDVSLDELFPSLDAGVLHDWGGIDLDFLAVAYRRDAVLPMDAARTRRFLNDRVLSRETAETVCDRLSSLLVEKAAGAATYRDWTDVAELKARIDVTAASYGVECSTNPLTDGAFRDFMLSRFGSLGGELDDSTPVLVSKAMDYMHAHSNRFAIIVMDGMSEFDWRVLSSSFAGIDYEQSAVYAMVPTITSVSRQSLLAGKYPRQLKNPWSQSGEKPGFYKCVRSWGFNNDRIAYLRGYDAEVPHGCDYAAYIILDVDERVHGQYGGRPGMLRDMELLAQGGKLAALVRRLMTQGLDVYITADHGNTPCVGHGRVTGRGVETESRGKRMLVVNDLADVDTLREKYGLIEFPGTFLDKEYRYYLCPPGVSFDDPGQHVMSHGGISIDEVVVPFITIRSERA
jgi:hypothetical protein